jgi:cation transport regulator ChaC
MPTPLPYFAFGSNLSREQMRERCPGAIELGCAFAEGFRLSFASHSLTWGGGVATLLRETGARTPGLLFSLTREDRDALDKREGHPFSYLRTRIRVRDARGRYCAAETYLLPDDEPQSIPSRAYIQHIWQAYAALGFEQALLMNAVARTIREAHAAAKLPLQWRPLSRS